MDRESVTRERLEVFLRELGRRYRGAGHLYLVGGTQIVYAGLRNRTEDIHYTVRLEGDHGEFASAVRSLIREMRIRHRLVISGYLRRLVGALRACP